MVKGWHVYGPTGQSQGPGPVSNIQHIFIAHLSWTKAGGHGREMVSVDQQEQMRGLG